MRSSQLQASTSGRVIHASSRPWPAAPPRLRAGNKPVESLGDLGPGHRRVHVHSAKPSGQGSSTKKQVKAPPTAPAPAPSGVSAAFRVIDTAAAATGPVAAATQAAEAGSVATPGVLQSMSLPKQTQDDVLRRSDERVRRLTTLVETRRLYRNLIRAQHLLGLPTPIYVAPPPPPEVEVDSEAAQAGSSAAAASVAGLSGGEELSEGTGERPGTASTRNPSAEEDKALKGALETAAEMALVAEQLKAGLRSLPAGFGSAIFSGASASTSEERVRALVRQVAADLRDRLAAELPNIPVGSDAALHYIEARNAKYSRRVALDELQGGGAGAGASSSDIPVVSPRKSALERLEAAERVAGEIIANNIKPALKKASEQDFLEVVKGTSSYLRGLWVRLNGGSPMHPAGLAAQRAGLDLPMPMGSQEQSELAISELSLELEGLEKKLQDASKNRENRLRKAGLQDRVQVAIQLKGLDAQVLHLSSMLAVRTLQLEMEHIFGSLEAEALDFFNGVQQGGLLARDGSTNELALLVAEFAWLDEQLTLLAAALQAGGEGPGNTTGAPASHGAPAGTAGADAAAAVVMGPALINDEVLGKLAAEIPDMRMRVGVADQTVFGGQGFSLTKARLQLRESLDKVKEAVNFLTRGFKLLGSDVGTGVRLFVKAALGNVLKPREVSALRRTARDLLTFIPFTIILIIPLSPLGHVLVFGFIQRYFPSFFPSQFSSRRQEIMVRYEELERQLLEAQATAEAAEEEVELARAREAVARLTAPESAAPILLSSAVVAAAAGAAVESGALVDTGLNGATGGAGKSARVLPAAGSNSTTSVSMSSVDEVTLHEATQKVRILSEQLDTIRDEVDLPHGDGPEHGQGEQGSRGNNGGRGSGRPSGRKQA
ncbi:hypothetical protein HYH02_014720 [Chlamydomonas schloesseri]|uniref:Letm1 RBD domain-containing protein n=1 Tax=Chlamydomonas schloesseri TaxID=2026947 RepID=A0A835VRT5_9CHLO|nr:hypothetical protein HYH02_014720 [Chlamydomonas schloesseri]|eukprot:KAG2426867.1 hypothetical protein HYH02_014720 [Chlamydomonas schloesseri]